VSRKAQLWSLYLTILLGQLGMAVALPILPALREQFGVSVAAVALTTSVWGLARLVLDLPLGAVVDRLPAGRVLLTGTLLVSAGSLLSIVAPNFNVLLAGRAIAGAGSAAISITAVVRIIALSEPGKRGRTLGTYQAMLQSGSAMSPVVAGFAAAAFGWRAAFGIAAISAAGAAVCVWASGVLRVGAAGEPDPSTAGDTQAEPDAAVERPRRLVTFHIFVANFATFMVFFANGGLAQNAIPLFGGLEIGLNEAALGLVLGIAAALRFAVGLGGAVLSDRYGRHVVLNVGFALLAVTAVVFPLVGNVVWFTVMTLALSATRLGNAVPVALLSDRIPQHHAGRAISINRFTGDFALLIGPAATGLAIEHLGFAGGFWLVAGLAVISVGVIGIDQWLDRKNALIYSGHAPEARGDHAS
jgi:MFS family permease